VYYYYYYIFLDASSDVTVFTFNNLVWLDICEISFFQYRLWILKTVQKLAVFTAFL